MRILVVPLCALLAAPAWSDPGEDARAAAEALVQATEALETAQGAPQQITALTQSVRAYEEGLAALRESLRDVAVRQSEIKARFDDEADEFGLLLTALVQIERTPRPVLFLHPGGAEGGARAGMLVASVTQETQIQLRQYAEDLRDLATLETVQSTAEETLQVGLRSVQSARAALALARQERRPTPENVALDAARTEELLRGAESLDALAQALRTTEAVSGDTLPDSLLSLPVVGTLLRHADTPDAAGVTRPGVVIAAPPGSLVVTPVAATMRFAGTMKDLGLVVILEPAPDVLFVLAGLGEVFAASGDILEAGTAVGFMPKDDAAGSRQISATQLDPLQELPYIETAESLYVEVREGSAPVDPATWFDLGEALFEEPL